MVWTFFRRKKLDFYNFFSYNNHPSEQPRSSRTSIPPPKSEEIHFLNVKLNQFGSFRWSGLFSCEPVRDMCYSDTYPPQLADQSNTRKTSPPRQKLILQHFTH